MLRIFFISVLLCPVVLWAQTIDSIITIKPFEVVSPRVTIQENTYKVRKVDSVNQLIYQHSHLADLLSNTGHQFIKTYGMGGLATSSFRGGSAAHTAIIWNGLTINSPFNGLMDLSLIPVSLFNDISVQYGGSSGLWGSGAVGGSIQLSNQLAFDQKTKLKSGLVLGSFGKKAVFGGSSFGNKSYSGNVKAYFHSAQNNFHFTHPEDSSTQNQTNSDFESTGLLTEHKWKLKNQNVFQFSGWLQHNERGIPPTFFEFNSKARQLDQSIRISSLYTQILQSWNLYVRGGYFFDELIFEDPNTNLYSFNQSHLAILEAEAAYSLTSTQQILVGVNHTSSFARADGYQLTETNFVDQQRTDLYTSYQMNALNQKLKGDFSLRQTFVDGRLKPFVYSLGAAYQLYPFLNVYANHAKVYRIPTLNDRFWIPGGNPNLRAEEGFSNEIGVNLKGQFKGLLLNHQSSIYSRHMNNMILWLPQAGIWTPRNVVSTWSRGLETQTEVSYTIKDWAFSGELFSQYVPSTFESPVAKNDASEGKQLPYTPMYSGHGSLSIAYKNFRVMYIHHYTGYRYITNDNYQHLAPFETGQVRLIGNFHFKNTHNISSFIQLNNVWNETYQVLINRPMPSVNWAVGISYLI